jgi:hypothetical protein
MLEILPQAAPAAPAAAPEVLHNTNGCVSQAHLEEMSMDMFPPAGAVPGARLAAALAGMPPTKTVRRGILLVLVEAVEQAFVILVPLQFLELKARRACSVKPPLLLI